MLAPNYVFFVEESSLVALKFRLPFLLFARRRSLHSGAHRISTRSKGETSTWRPPRSVCPSVAKCVKHGVDNGHNASTHGMDNVVLSR
jgi:hypothetical protein